MFFKFFLDLGPYGAVFADKEELQLVNYHKKMDRILFGLTTIDFRRSAFDLAEKNGKNHKYNRENRIAGYDWFHIFMKKHSANLSLCMP